MRPSRFSSPSMYLALLVQSVLATIVAISAPVLPFWRVPLLLYLSEDTLGLVVFAMGAFGHLSITLDLLLPAHVAGAGYPASLGISLTMFAAALVGVIVGVASISEICSVMKTGA